MIQKVLLVTLCVLVLACSTVSAALNSTPTAVPTPSAPATAVPTQPQGIPQITIRPNEQFCYFGDQVIADFWLYFRPGPDFSLDTDSSVPLAFMPDPKLPDGNHYLIILPSQTTAGDGTVLFRVEILGDKTIRVTDTHPTLRIGPCQAPGNPA